MSIFKGSGVAVVTPFQHGSIDFTAFTRLLELQIASGTDAIVCGTVTGEAQALTVDERLSVIQFVVERVNGRVPVLASTGGCATAAVVETSKAAEAIGVDGLLVVTPYFSKTTQDGLVAHFGAVAESVDTPFLVCNLPSRTGQSILPATIARLRKHKRFAGVVDDGSSMEQLVALAALCPDCDLYSSSDSNVLPLMSIGGKGVISTVANVVPNAVHALCEAFFKGDLNRARKLQFQLMPLIRAALCEESPIPVKAMMGLMRLCEPDVRLPLVAPSNASLRAIEETLKEYQLI